MYSSWCRRCTCATIRTALYSAGTCTFPDKPKLAEKFGETLLCSTWWQIFAFSTSHTVRSQLTQLLHKTYRKTSVLLLMPLLNSRAIHHSTRYSWHLSLYIEQRNMLRKILRQWQGFEWMYSFVFTLFVRSDAFVRVSSEYILHRMTRQWQHKKHIKHAATSNWLTIFWHSLTLSDNATINCSHSG
jgi:hypothetical protein